MPQQKCTKPKTTYSAGRAPGFSSTYKLVFIRVVIVQSKIVQAVNHEQVHCKSRITAYGPIQNGGYWGKSRSGRGFGRPLLGGLCALPDAGRHMTNTRFYVISGCT